ncbi:MAG: tRNA pseudouridine(38-40) synthase TruA [Bacilli bacterium]|nr:tRNA pseudouridine(38-40) synthase TruA [Bacilli bacterium]
MRYKITFSYDGSKFNGYQKQKGISNTIQGKIEEALKSINNGLSTKFTSSGRTDKGVSAYKQVGSCDIGVNITPYKLKRAMNSLLPDTIHVIDALEVDDDFHPRYMLKEKTYVYKVNTGEYNPIEKDYVCQLCKKLDINLLKEEIKDFIGEHDFTAFCSTQDRKENCVRTIFDAYIKEDGNYVYFTFKGNGFLKYMVRIMCGYLISVSLGKTKPNNIKTYFKTKEKVATKTAAATGLYLEDVKY